MITMRFDCHRLCRSSRRKMSLHHNNNNNHHHHHNMTTSIRMILLTTTILGLLGFLWTSTPTTSSTTNHHHHHYYYYCEAFTQSSVSVSVLSSLQQKPWGWNTRLKLSDNNYNNIATSIPISYPKITTTNQDPSVGVTDNDTDNENDVVSWINVTQDENENFIIHSIVRKKNNVSSSYVNHPKKEEVIVEVIEKVENPLTPLQLQTPIQDDNNNNNITTTMTNYTNNNINSNNNNINDNHDDDDDTITSSSSSSSIPEQPLQPLPSPSSLSSTITTTTSNNNDKMTLLSEFDPILYDLIQKEEDRQRMGLELIASENFCSTKVRSVLSTGLTNKYSEGLPYARYYGGNQYIDQIEVLCIQRALQLYELDNHTWGVNVQPYSGSPANFAVYTALLQPHDRIMGLDLPSGGHLTHGYQTKKGKKVSATSIYFESMPYIVNPITGYIDYDDMEYRANMFLPKLIIAGGSAYPREWDYARIRSICNSINATMMVDMAHISGLVAGKVVQSPFLYADIVTSTTHKTLRGPRSGLIFAKLSYMDAINSAVFPALQGGPHNHQIGALAVALKEAMTPEFKIYTQQVLNNAQTLVTALQERQHILATNGTDNHLLLWNVRASSGGKLTGSKFEIVLDRVSITTNKNSIVGDTSALNPGGIRLGTPALTTRGFQSKDFQYVATLLQEGYDIAMDIEQIATNQRKQQPPPSTPFNNILNIGAAPTTTKKPTTTTSTYSEFVSVMEQNTLIQQRMQTLKETVEAFASQFPMP